MWWISLFEAIAKLPFIALHIITQNSFPKPLSKKEEIKYLSMLNTENNNAKEKLIQHNLRLVAHISKKYHFKNNDIDDLISIGTIGLIKAVNTFNPEKGVRLSSYASRCIENEILMHFRSNSKSCLDVSMDEPIETDKNGNILTLIDTIACNNCIADEIDLKMDIQKLSKHILSNLNNRERVIICLRYGLSGQKPMPQREVAKKLKISRSYVSRLEKKSINILKNFFCTKNS